MNGRIAFYNGIMSITVVYPIKDAINTLSCLNVMVVKTVCGSSRGLFPSVRKDFAAAETAGREEKQEKDCTRTQL